MIFEENTRKIKEIKDRNCELFSSTPGLSTINHRINGLITETKLPHIDGTLYKDFENTLSIKPVTLCQKKGPS